MLKDKIKKIFILKKQLKNIPESPELTRQTKDLSDETEITPYK